MQAQTTRKVLLDGTDCFVVYFDTNVIVQKFDTIMHVMTMFHSIIVNPDGSIEEKTRGTWENAEEFRKFQKLLTWQTVKTFEIGEGEQYVTDKVVTIRIPSQL